jgi:hypothetical protein
LGLDAAAAGVFADEATYLFDPDALRFGPDPSVWTQVGRLTPIAVPGRGLGAEAVGSTLSYTHVPPPLGDGLGAGLRAQLVTPFVPDDSGAWLDDAISPGLTVDDGRVQVTVVPARDAVTFERLFRVEDTVVELRLPFAWDNGYANVVDIDRRPDGKVAVTATNLDPAADGLSNTLLIDEAVLPSSDGRVKVKFFWDREGRKDSDSSCWVRVASLWGGKGWGVVTIPRIGQEVVVDFLEGDPDKPIVVGTVYDAEQLPPFPLPADPVSDVWTIRTSFRRRLPQLLPVRSRPGQLPPRATTLLRVQVAPRWAGAAGVALPPDPAAERLGCRARREEGSVALPARALAAGPRGAYSVGPPRRAADRRHDRLANLPTTRYGRRAHASQPVKQAHKPEPASALPPCQPTELSPTPPTPLTRTRASLRGKASACACKPGVWWSIVHA